MTKPKTSTKTIKASQYERDNLALYVESVPLFKAAQNVNSIGKADFVYPIGSSGLSATLHGASILLRVNDHWDWFINLSAADYPLVTQDAAQNVNFIGEADFVYPLGSSGLSATLHGASIPLRVNDHWDWFSNLSSADYPLVTQDGHAGLSNCYSRVLRYAYWMMLKMCSFYCSPEIFAYVGTDF
ncbi:hypothetical protein BC332_06567 [Capsicum chinense]|nr:hypothetical protein BC332_06567 [Capsicum chinense]